MPRVLVHIGDFVPGKLPYVGSLRMSGGTSVKKMRVEDPQDVWIPFVSTILSVDIFKHQVAARLLNDSLSGSEKILSLAY